MAHLNEALTTSEVLLNTDKAYVQLVKAKEMKKVAEKYHALLTELSRNVKSAHQHGMKPQNDVLKVQVKLNDSELSLRKADNALRLASTPVPLRGSHRKYQFALSKDVRCNGKDSWKQGEGHCLPYAKKVRCR